MSRIRDALTKIEGGTLALPGPLPARAREAMPIARPFETSRGAEPAREIESTPVLEAAPAHAVPARTEEALPGLPAEFHRELSGLRFAIESALPDRATRVILFTAASFAEGTTTVASSFARILAQDPSQSVLLVDANVRRPGVSLFFGVAPGPGLREVVHAGGAVAPPVQAVERHNLHVLTTLPSAGSSGQIFAPEAVRDFWGRHGGRYQWVIVDAAPILEAPETAILATTVDTTVVVVQAGRTKRGVVQRAMDVFGKTGAPVLGAVLNRRRFEIPEFIYRRI